MFEYGRLCGGEESVRDRKIDFVSSVPYIFIVCFCQYLRLMHSLFVNSQTKTRPQMSQKSKGNPPLELSSFRNYITIKLLSRFDPNFLRNFQSLDYK